jgi:hypothetical protein
LGSNSLRAETRQLLLPVFKFVRSYNAASFFTLAPRNSLDLSFTCALALMVVWRGEYNSAIPFHLIHDQSSNMVKQSSWWDYLNNPNQPEFVETDPCRMVYPAAIDRTDFVDDKDWAGVQLADIAAGAVHRATSWAARGQDPSDSYGRELAEIIDAYPRRMILAMVPDRDVSDGKLSLAGQDASPALSYILERVKEFDSQRGWA